MINNILMELAYLSHESIKSCVLWAALIYQLPSRVPESLSIDEISARVSRPRCLLRWLLSAHCLCLALITLLPSAIICSKQQMTIQTKPGEVTLHENSLKCILCKPTTVIIKQCKLQCSSLEQDLIWVGCNSRTVKRENYHMDNRRSYTYGAEIIAQQ